MIVNNEDLLPLGGASKPPFVPKTADEDFGDFTARVAETFDSVDLLLAARAEAEEAEEKAKAVGETKLPFLKEDKAAAKPPTCRGQTAKRAACSETALQSEGRPRMTNPRRPSG